MMCDPVLRTFLTERAEFHALKEFGGYYHPRFKDGEWMIGGWGGLEARDYTIPDIAYFTGNHWEAVEVKVFGLSEYAHISSKVSQTKAQLLKRKRHLPNGFGQRLYMLVVGDAWSVEEVRDYLKKALSSELPEVVIQVKKYPEYELFGIRKIGERRVGA